MMPKCDRQSGPEHAGDWLCALHQAGNETQVGGSLNMQLTAPVPSAWYLAGVAIPQYPSKVDVTSDRARLVLAEPSAVESVL